MPSLVHDGVRFYYERSGSGPTLLWISGTNGDLRVHPNAFDSPFASSFDLIGYDQRGLGQTEVPPGPYSMAGYGDDAAGVLDALGIERAYVLGLSFGGMVAQELVLRHPDRVTRLVLCCTSTGGAGGASYPLHELVDLVGAERAAAMLPLADGRLAELDADDPERTAAERAYASSAPMGDGARLQLEARRHHDTFERLGEITCPVYVCGGRYDNIAPLSNLEALAQAIPGSRLEVFEGGHGFLWQDPKAFRSIGAFFSE